MSQFNIDEVTLTLDADLVMEWSVKDVSDLEAASGMILEDWAQAMKVGRLPMNALRAWCWIENRRRWPSFTLEAVNQLTVQKLYDLVLKNNAAAEAVEAAALSVVKDDEDSPLEVVGEPTSLTS